jgi:hypothetical protein
VLLALTRDYGDAPPAWFAGPGPHARSVVAAAPTHFAEAFNRWRDLLAAAERQVEDAARTLKDYSISPQERRAAETRQAAGNIQIKLLLRGAEGQGSDFYVYRYLATEAFLPGYNFPRLPLMAFVPGGQGGKGQRYIQRARFLAIAEFGPGSLVYHEGRAYRVDRALLKEAGGGQDGNLPTFSTAICSRCGACHDGEPPEECHACQYPLSGANITVYDPWHYVPVLARKPGALRNGAPFKDWVLPAAIERVRRKLASADDGNRQMVDILNAVLTDGLPAVEAACAEATAHGVHSADVVLNILARQRDPAPPANILTPAALTLRHAPIADCARYDNLRRTI